MSCAPACRLCARIRGRRSRSRPEAVWGCSRPWGTLQARSCMRGRCLAWWRRGVHHAPQVLPPEQVLLVRMLCSMAMLLAAPRPMTAGQLHPSECHAWHSRHAWRAPVPSCVGSSTTVNTSLCKARLRTCATEISALCFWFQLSYMPCSVD